MSSSFVQTTCDSERLYTFQLDIGLTEYCTVGLPVELICNQSNCITNIYLSRSKMESAGPPPEPSPSDDDICWETFIVPEENFLTAPLESTGNLALFIPFNGSGGCRPEDGGPPAEVYQWYPLTL